MPTLALWACYTVSSEWRLRDAVASAVFLLLFSYALYPETYPVLRMVVAIGSVGLGSLLSYRYTLRPEVALIGALFLAMVGGVCMAWTLAAACGTLICVGAFVLATARRTRQSRPAK